MARAGKVPPALLLILHAKAEFVRGNIAAGRTPNGAQTATFMRETVLALGPHISASPPSVARQVLAGFASIGWDVPTNAPVAGTTPPSPDEILALLQKSFLDLRPSLKEARDMATAAATALSEEKRELSFAEEYAAEGGGGAKAERKLAALRQKIPGLDASAEAAHALAKAVEASSTAEEASQMAQEDVAERRIQAARLAATTNALDGGANAGQQARERRLATMGGAGNGGGKRGGKERGGRVPAATASVDRSDVSIVEAGTLRKGGHIVINEVACRIKELSTSKTGKHGHSKVKIVAIDCTTGKRVDTFFPSSEKQTVPGKRWLEALGPPTS